jgi:type IV secretion system protein VirD4
VERDGLSPGEALLLTAAVALLVVGFTVWAGAALSAWTVGQDFPAGFGDAVDAGIRLPAHMSDPASAWRPPIGGSLPGAAVYWPLTGAVALVTVVALVAALRIFRRRVGTAQRQPLGVDARSRFATVRDLAPMLIRRPETGRFVLGRVGRRLVATEKPSRRRRRGRASDRGAVALIGPSRSGKTTAAVGGILDWHGPAVLSSVKADLLATTYTWRAGRGEVLVYDPTQTTGMATASWTPLREAGSIIGAQRAARSLCDAAPRGDNVEGGLDFWLTQAEILLSGLLWVAANKNLDMAAVCEWVMVQDSPSEASKGQVKTFVDELISDDDEEVRDGAAQAARSLLSVWRMEERTRSSVYATAQSVVWPWADPGVAAASKGIGVNLDWLLESERTVYLCAPIEDQQRLAPAFGGLLNDIIRQVYLKVARTNRPLDPPLLVVVDEAGNTPLRALPEYASTLAGLGVLLVTIWQSLAQIEEAYRGHSDTIITNHLSKVFYGGQSDPIALRYLSQVLGDFEVDTTSRTRHHGPDSTQFATTHLPLVPPHAARQMRSGGALLIHGTLPPAHIRTRAWWKDRRLSARVARDFDAPAAQKAAEKAAKQKETA